MKKQILNSLHILTFLYAFAFGESQIKAQNTNNRFPLHIGYFSHAGYQPGLKIGTQFNFKQWTKENYSKAFAKHRKLFISPQLAFYINPNIHQNYLFNVDWGYQSSKEGKASYSAWSIGLGYLHQQRITDWSVNLSDGSKTKTKESSNWFLPSVNYAFGSNLNSRIGWYSKFSYGLKMASQEENTAVLFVEMGLKFSL